jgi:hypothetical protein
LHRLPVLARPSYVLGFQELISSLASDYGDYFCPVPVWRCSVAGAAPAWVLFDPGTTLLPVAPGTLLFVAAALEGAVVDPASAELRADAALESAVPGDAVAELLLPRFPAGFVCAMATARGGTIKPAASTIKFNLKRMLHILPAQTVAKYQ